MRLPRASSPAIADLAASPRHPPNYLQANASPRRTPLPPRPASRRQAQHRPRGRHARRLRLLHHHLAVNPALALYDFGTPGFIALREPIWFDVFRRARADDLSALIFTFNPEDPVPQRLIDALFAGNSAAGAELIPVELIAAESTLEASLANPSRFENGKLTDLALYRQLRDAGVLRLPSSRLRASVSIPLR